MDKCSKKFTPLAEKAILYILSFELRNGFRKNKIDKGRLDSKVSVEMGPGFLWLAPQVGRFYYADTNRYQQIPESLATE